MTNNRSLSEQEMWHKGRRVLLLMFIFFSVPIIVVGMMFQFDWKPSGTSLGELVRPARLLSVGSHLKTETGDSVKAQFWKEQWSIVYVADSCLEDCLNKLQDMRQLHVSLYKDIPRVQRVLITNAQNVNEIKTQYPDLIVLNQSSEDVANLMQQFRVNNENAATSYRLYLVDPLGQLMMSYSSGVPLADVRKDVIRLLKYSWAG